MRTSLDPQPSRIGSTPTVIDLAAAMRDAGTAICDTENAPDTGRADTPRSKLAIASSVAIPEALAKAADEALDAALEGRHPIDPLFGPILSAPTSAANAAVKRSGGLIEQSLKASFERAGFVVIPRLRMQLSAAARALVAENAPATLRGVSVTASDSAEGPEVEFDLAVYCPRTRRAWLLEVKRGSGSTELRKIKPIVATLQAGALQLKAHLARLGLKVTSIDAKVIDYYGRSGFPDDARIIGAELDKTFRAPIRPLVELVLARYRRRFWEKLPLLIATSLRSIAASDQPEGRTLMTLPNGLKVAPEHLRSIELAPRRRGRPKKTSQVITLPRVRHGGGQPPATVQ